MANLVERDSRYSTTRCLTRREPVFDNNSAPEFQTTIFAPKAEKRKEEGGLRTKGFFKQSQPNKPLISIVTVVYNGERFLEKTIRSVIDQTYDNVEYIIIDGGSSDKTIDIIKKYEHAIDYWISEKDAGMYDAISKGFKVCFGDIFAWINADDQYQAGAFKTVAALMKDRGIDWLTGVPTAINSEGGFLAVEHPKIYPKALIKLGFFRGDLLGFIQQESTFFSATLYKKSPLNVNLKLAGDYHLWCGFSEYSDLKTVKVILASFRIHGDQKSSDMVGYLKECDLLKRNFFPKIAIKFTLLKYILKLFIVLMDHKMIKPVKIKL